MRLTELETAALLALAGHDGPVPARTLARDMTALGLPAFSDTARRAVAVLTREGLAFKAANPRDQPRARGRWGITARGRDLIDQYRQRHAKTGKDHADTDD